MRVHVRVNVQMNEVSDELRGGAQPAAQRQTAAAGSSPEVLSLRVSAYVHVRLAANLIVCTAL